jgi:hypothetical protein
MDDRPVSVLVVDDHRLMREGTAALLRADERVEVAGLAPRRARGAGPGRAPRPRRRPARPRHARAAGPRDVRRAARAPSRHAAQRARPGRARGRPRRAADRAAAGAADAGRARERERSGRRPARRAQRARARDPRATASRSGGGIAANGGAGARRTAASTASRTRSHPAAPRGAAHRTAVVTSSATSRSPLAASAARQTRWRWAAGMTRRYGPRHALSSTERLSRAQASGPRQATAKAIGWSRSDAHLGLSSSQASSITRSRISTSVHPAASPALTWSESRCT